jgi:hypothetical protein
VDARGVGVRGMGKGEWDGDWEESGEKRVDAIVLRDEYG